MRRFASLAAIGFLLSAPAAAQIRGLGSASLPSRPEISKAPPDSQVLSKPRAEQRDRYRARPRTYEPSRRRQRYFFPWATSGYGYAEPWYEEPVPEPPRPPEPALRPPPPETPSTRAVDIPPRPPLPPGKPKTFYVIPNCYAGDRRPDVERLPAGCDPAKLRVIPPND